MGQQRVAAALREEIREGGPEQQLLGLAEVAAEGLVDEGQGGVRLVAADQLGLVLKDGA